MEQATAAPRDERAATGADERSLAELALTTETMRRNPVGAADGALAGGLLVGLILGRR